MISWELLIPVALVAFLAGRFQMAWTVWKSEKRKRP